MEQVIEKIGQGEPLVLLPGLGCDHHYLTPLAQALSQDYCVYNCDIPMRKVVSLHQGIDVFERIAAPLITHLPAKAIYVGWSFGGLLATFILSRYPERVASFIGLATTPKFMATSTWPGMPAPGFMAMLDRLKAEGWSDYFKANYKAAVSQLPEHEQLYQWLLNQLAISPIPDLALFEHYVVLSQTIDLRQAVNHSQCKMTYLFGEDDELISSAAQKAIMALNPHVKTDSIQGAGHLFPVTHADITAEKIKATVNHRQVASQQCSQKGKRKLHHLGYACHSIEEGIAVAKRNFTIISVGEIIHDALQNATLCLLTVKGAPNIELVSGEVNLP